MSSSALDLVFGAAMRTCCNRVSRANTLEKCDKILRRAFAVAMSVAVLLF